MVHGDVLVTVRELCSISNAPFTCAVCSSVLRLAKSRAFSSVCETGRSAVAGRASIPCLALRRTRRVGSAHGADRTDWAV